VPTDPEKSSEAVRFGIEIFPAWKVMESGMGPGAGK